MRAVLILALLIGCKPPEEVIPDPTPREVLRDRLLSLAPGNLGHRGLGPSRPGHAYPENSMSAFLEALEQGADGVELDVGLTSDGVLAIMHDDDLARTTDCTGCISAITAAAFADCRLLDDAGLPTDEAPPTLTQVYDTLPASAIVNIEIKVTSQACATETVNQVQGALAAVAVVASYDAAERTMFSSFGDDAIAAIKQAQPDWYAAHIARFSLGEATVDAALDLGADAVNPPFAADDPTTPAALAAGLQVHLWNADLREDIVVAMASDVTSLITDEPGIVEELRTARR